jgi:hypothetical protein
MKVKFFSKIISAKPSWKPNPHEAFDCGMENEINTWGEQNPTVVIKDIKQTLAGGGWTALKLVITVWYEE